MVQALTRRALVGAAPAAAVAASLPVLFANAQPAAHPDAALMRLAVDFDRLHAEWQDLLDWVEEVERTYKARIAPTARTQDDFIRCRDEVGFDDAITKAEDKVQELDVVANQMRAILARTLHGLAIKARLTQFDVHLSRRSEMTRPERDWDWDVRCMEHFVRELQRFADLAVAGGANA